MTPLRARPHALNTLKSWPRNPRRITPARMEQLKRSMAADPQMVEARPLVALPDGTVIMGNQRLAAARELGWTRIHTVMVDLDEETAATWAFRDNQGYGEWDDDLAGDLIAELAGRGVDLDFAGFAPPDLQRMLDRASTPPVGVDDAPPLPKGKPRSRLGEVYELGPHRLLCGDATDPEAYDALLQGERARVVFTDPPYGVEYTGGHKPREGLVGDEHGTGIYMASLPLMVEHAARDASFYVWYADLSVAAAAAAAAAAGLVVRCQVIWVKNNAQFFSNARYHGKHEPCIYAAQKTGTAAWYGPKNEVTVWEADRAQSNEYHPTQKPVALAERALRNSSKRGDVVLDPFAGSGSTLVGAEVMSRRCFAMEIDPAYCDVIRARYEALKATT